MVISGLKSLIYEGLLQRTDSGNVVELVVDVASSSLLRVTFRRATRIGGVGYRFADIPAVVVVNPASRFFLSPGNR